MTANPQQHNSYMMQEDIYSLLAAMLQKEGDYLCQNYLATDCSDDTEIDVDACRSKMCQWIYQVVDCTRLQRETAAVAVSYLDRFMCTTSFSAYKARYDRKEYQLCALTSLYIATKIFEPFALDASLVSKLSRGLHTTEEIIALEYEILTALRWRVNGKLATIYSSIAIPHYVTNKFVLFATINRSNIVSICELPSRASNL